MQRCATPFFLQATLEKLDLEVEPWSPSAWTPNLLLCMWFGNPEYSRSKGSYLLAGSCLSENPVRWLEVAARGNITSGFWQPCADTRYPKPNHWSLSCGIHKIKSKCTSACLKSLKERMKCITTISGRWYYQFDLYRSWNRYTVWAIRCEKLRYSCHGSLSGMMTRSSRWARAWSDRSTARSPGIYNTQLSYSTAASHQLAKSLVERGFDDNFMLVQLR